MVNNQASLFIIFTLNGILIGILFDIFRILRKTFKTNDIITYMEDIIFWIISGITILYSMCMYSDGELRFFMILGLIIGTITYMLTLSKYVIKMSVIVLTTIKNILIYPFKIIYKTTRKIIIRPIYIICINIRKNITVFIKKIGGFFEKKEKYNI